MQITKKNRHHRTFCGVGAAFAATGFAAWGAGFGIFSLFEPFGLFLAPRFEAGWDFKFFYFFYNATRNGGGAYVACNTKRARARVE